MVKKAVESQPKCNFSMDNYEEFLVASAHYVPENKASIYFRVSESDLILRIHL